MREVLFRGKRVDNGKWVYGSLYIWKEAKTSPYKKFRIGSFVESRMRHYEVDPSTVGQFTGLTDKNNGAKIFEGDIIKGKFCKYVIWFDETERAFVYSNSYKGGYRHHMSDYLLKSAFPHGIEVIGNIHDNPELLGGDDK